MHCVYCGAKHTERCHVKDKSFFEKGTSNKIHERNNIINLCSYCHDYFDAGKIGIYLEGEQLLALIGNSPESIVINKSKSKLVLDKAYVDEKNSRTHVFIRARLRKLKKILVNNI